MPTTSLTLLDRLRQPDHPEAWERFARLYVPEIIRPHLTAVTWEAFREFVLNGRPAAEVARELGISANAVYLARNRVLTRLRAELGELLD